MAAARKMLWCATWIVLLGYTIGLLFHGTGFQPWIDGMLGVSTNVFPALVCWFALPGAGERRREVLCLALAVSAFCLGNSTYALAAGLRVALTFPSLADAGYLSFSPLILAAIALGVRRELRGVSASVWLDSVLGGLGGACFLAVLLGPVFEHLAGGILAKTVAVAYPMFDLLLMATVVGVTALNGCRFRSPWFWPLAGLAVMTAADLTYTLRVADNDYAIGTLLDAIWPLGLALVAGWARSPESADRDQRPVLAMPVLATFVAVSILALASRTRVSSVAVALAITTLAATVGRTHLAFRQLRRLADLRRQATTDELTGLPNRRALYAAIRREMAGTRRPRALLLLDLDRFKEVNDSLGHHIGDQLLILTSQRLRAQLRTQDVLARLGGDEFAVLLPGAGQAYAMEVAARLRGSLADPLTLGGIALHTGVSIGIALSPDHGGDGTMLLRRADMAMYKAKAARSGYEVYVGSDDDTGQQRLRTIHELRVALDKRQIILHYQPKIDLDTAEVRGVEALVRWNHPTRGLLMPGSFLDLVELSGLMGALSRQVLDQALRQAALWQSQGFGLRVAVNLSADSLLDPSLPAYLASQLARHELKPDSLQLEITEQTLMADLEQARIVLDAIRALGVQISIDDFGTGYSSLAYLRDLPVDELKLDRLFITPMAHDVRAKAVVGSTISLAHSLGLRIVAEGVEDSDTYEELRRLGCDQVQGFYVFRPAKAAVLERWLRRSNALPRPRSPSIAPSVKS